MKISGISSAFPYTFLMPEKDDSGSSPAAMQDTINVHAPQILDDSEVDTVLDETLQMLAADPVSALSAHGGLNQNRVFALVGA